MTTSVNLAPNSERYSIGTQGCTGVVGMSNAAKSLREQEASQGAFMVAWGATGRTGRCREVVGKAERGKKMASMMKVIVGSEGSRCHHDERPRLRGSQGKSREAYT